MASIDKQSVRDEFEKVKAGIKEQIDAGKISSEAATLINTLIMLFGLLMSIFMEKKTKKTSKNSGIPSSQTSKDETSNSKSKSNGKGTKESTKLAGNTRTVETKEILPVVACSCCGEDLIKVKAHNIERRTRIDIIFEKTVERWDAEIKDCPSCKMTSKGEFPQGLSGPLQYGNGIKAYAISLLVTQMISLNRAISMLATLIGNKLSEATLLSYIMKLYLALESWETHQRQELLFKSCIHTDETSFRVNGKNYWIHVYSSEEITLKFLHKKRGKEAIENIELIPKYGGVIVHDCWASYLSYQHCGHGLCGSHLLRELTFIIDSNQYRWAKNMKSLLQEACKMISSSPDKCLTDCKYRTLQRRYRNLLSRAEKEMPPIPNKPNGKKGKVAKSDAHNLWERLKVNEKAVLLFAKMPEVAFTNNRAERDLRMSKVKQKISGCFRNVKYAHAYCRISSYLQTMKLKGINPIIAVSMALNGEV